MRMLLPLVFLISSCATVATEDSSNLGLVHVKSQFSVDATTQRLVNILTNKKMTIFNRVDHAKNAQSVGLSLAETQLVIFGNPKMGTKLMQCAPSVAIDLPMKFAINKDKKGDVWISYNSPEYLASRHQIKGCEKIIAKMTGALAKISAKAANKIY